MPGRAGHIPKFLLRRLRGRGHPRYEIPACSFFREACLDGEQWKHAHTRAATPVLDISVDEIQEILPEPLELRIDLIELLDGSLL